MRVSQQTVGGAQLSAAALPGDCPGSAGIAIASALVDEEALHACAGDSLPAEQPVVITRPRPRAASSTVVCVGAAQSFKGVFRMRSLGAPCVPMRPDPFVRTDTPEFGLSPVPRIPGSRVVGHMTQARPGRRVEQVPELLVALAPFRPAASGGLPRVRSRNTWSGDA
jgi:hypothetical protein